MKQYYPYPGKVMPHYYIGELLPTLHFLQGTTNIGEFSPIDNLDTAPLLLISKFITFLPGSYYLRYFVDKNYPKISHHKPGLF